MANTINFSFDNFEAKPVDDLAQSYSHTSKGPVVPPTQGGDSDEYLCGNSGPEQYGSCSAGQDQDQSRVDERIAAQGTSRYVSAGPTPASYGSTGEFSYDTEGAY
jgi:hypothetical protein